MAAVRLGSGNALRRWGRLLVSRAFQPVDVACLVFFRVAFGLLMAGEIWRYLHSGWVESYYIAPDFHFTYPGFGWVSPWPGEGMVLHCYALGLLALFIAFGCLYRLSAALFFLGFSYVFLLDEAYYLNHFYLISLLAFLTIFLPAHRSFSIDARLRPRLRSEVAPAWALWLLRSQMGIVYFYAGLAKLNWDWLAGQPMRLWLPGSVDLPLVGALFDQAWLAVLLSYGGVLFDLAIVPALLWRRTRRFAFAAAACFHLMNALIFQIGVFPWLAIVTTALFFEPDWPRRFFSRFRSRPVARAIPDPWQGWDPRQRATVWLCGVYLALQLLIPFRHWLYPGDVAWTEEGHRFAWRMKLRTKEAVVAFFLRDPRTGGQWHADPLEHITTLQEAEMAAKPYMIHQFAQFLAEQARREGRSQVEVRAVAVASLNGREPRVLIDPEVDLAARPRRVLRSSPWIVPLEKADLARFRSRIAERLRSAGVGDASGADSS